MRYNERIDDAGVTSTCPDQASCLSALNCSKGGCRGLRLPDCLVERYILSTIPQHNLTPFLRHWSLPYTSLHSINIPNAGFVLGRGPTFSSVSCKMSGHMNGGMNGGKLSPVDTNDLTR